MHRLCRLALSAVKVLTWQFVRSLCCSECEKNQAPWNALMMDHLYNLSDVLHYKNVRVGLTLTGEWFEPRILCRLRGLRIVPTRTVVGDID